MDKLTHSKSFEAQEKKGENFAIFTQNERRKTSIRKENGEENHFMHLRIGAGMRNERTSNHIQSSLTLLRTHIFETKKKERKHLNELTHE